MIGGSLRGCTGWMQAALACSRPALLAFGRVVGSYSSRDSRTVRVSLAGERWLAGRIGLESGCWGISYISRAGKGSEVLWKTMGSPGNSSSQASSSTLASLVMIFRSKGETCDL